MIDDELAARVLQLYQLRIFPCARLQHTVECAQRRSPALFTRKAYRYAIRIIPRAGFAARRGSPGRLDGTDASLGNGVRLCLHLGLVPLSKLENSPDGFGARSPWTSMTSFMPVPAVPGRPQSVAVATEGASRQATIPASSPQPILVRPFIRAVPPVPYPDGPGQGSSGATAPTPVPAPSQRLGCGRGQVVRALRFLTIVCRGQSGSRRSRLGLRLRLPEQRPIAKKNPCETPSIRKQRGLRCPT